MNIDDKLLMTRLIEEANKRWFKRPMTLERKDKVWIFRLMNFFMNFVYRGERKDEFYKRFWTTWVGLFLLQVRVGYATSYEEEDIHHWEVVGHEIGHGLQGKRWTPPVFNYLYLWPISQGIALLLFGWIGGFFMSGWQHAMFWPTWIILTGIHFIPKLPDPWRRRWELECYELSMAFYYVTNKDIPDWYIESLVRRFTNMSYYQMAWSAERIRKDLRTSRIGMYNGNHRVYKHPVYRLVTELRREQKEKNDG